MGYIGYGNQNQNKRKNFYVVIHGLVDFAIFTEWEDCLNSVDGVPFAKYRGFATGEEAMDYLLKERKAYLHKEYSEKDEYYSNDELKKQYQPKKEFKQNKNYLNGNYGENNPYSRYSQSVKPKSVREIMEIVENKSKLNEEQNEKLMKELDETPDFQ